MKKKSNFFRIDERVFFTLAGLCVISLILIAFKFSTRTDCGPLSIQIVSETMIAGQPIRFEAVTNKGKNFAWTFGDTTNGLEAHDPKITHVYHVPGTYMVRVVVDGECSAFQELHVFPDRPVVNFGFQPLFKGPTVAYVNEAFEVEDTSSSAKTWEWSFEADGPVEETKRKVRHTYYTPGLKYITLKVDGRNDRTISMAVNVIERVEKKDEDKRENERPRRTQVPLDLNPQVKPLTDQLEKQQPEEDVAPKPAPVQVYPQIEHAAVEAMFMDVVNKKKTAADFAQYLCNSASLIAYETRFIPLAELCAELAKKKNVNRVVVNQKKVGEARCLEIVAVTVEKKKGFLKNLFNKQ